jgi:hypothetical protein
LLRRFTGKNKKQSIKYLILVLIFVFSLANIVVQKPQPANAFACGCCEFLGCLCWVPTAIALAVAIVAAHEVTRDVVFGTSGNTNMSGGGGMGLHEDYLVDVIFEDHIGESMVQMAEQFSGVMMQQIHILGQFLDAKQQMKVLRVFQEKELEALKDYTPDVNVCSIGTNIRSIATTERFGEITSAVLNERSIARQLGNANVNASEGRNEDREGRIQQFIDVFCDRDDNHRLVTQPGTGLEAICPGAPNDDERVNIDIDYTRAIELPLTLELDFSDPTGGPTDEEENIISMHNYLYAHDVPVRPTGAFLQNKENLIKYLDLRAIVAKRGVAEHSFNQILAMKTQGSAANVGGPAAGSSEDTQQYMGAILEEIGFSDAEIDEIYGERPSYMAQMELLAKNMYQRADFFTELYGKPVNALRQNVAMQAIGLMLERDIFESRLRSENILSILLELEVAKNQEEVDNTLSKLEDDE